MHRELLSAEVQSFIRSHEHVRDEEIVLKNQSISGVPASVIATQISGRKKAREKLPTYYKTPFIVFPPGKNLEQSSSEKTAAFKTDFLRGNIPLSSKGSCADLTGGFGIDSFFFQSLVSVHYVEPDRSLLEIAQHNHQLLGALNIFYYPSTAEDFLRTASQSFDFIFIDPSRRAEGNKKVFQFSDTIPNVIDLLDLIFERTPFLLIKASPLLDIQLGMKQLKSVKKVIIVSVDNDCKELLYFCQRDYCGEPSLETYNLKGNQTDFFGFRLSEERDAEIYFSEPRQFLFEPNASLLKAGAFKALGHRFSLFKLQASTHFYTSDKWVPDFPGRIFQIEKLIKPDPKSIQEIFPEGKANITTRNYPLSVDELRKKTRLKDGGDRYLIGFSGVNKKYLAAATRLR